MKKSGVIHFHRIKKQDDFSGHPAFNYSPALFYNTIVLSIFRVSSSKSGHFYLPAAFLRIELCLFTF